MKSSEIQLRLGQERSDVLATIEEIKKDFDALIAASADANGDDEHDPEGATLAFERAQLASLLKDTRQTLASIESAIAKAEDGSYGACEHCGGSIAEERLRVLPWTRTCFSCANGS